MVSEFDKFFFHIIVLSQSNEITNQALNLDVIVDKVFYCNGFILCFVVFGSNKKINHYFGRD